MKRITMSLLLLLIGISAKADTVWDISGQITSNGNNNSSVTVDYSYMMDVGATNFSPTYAMSDSSAMGSGSLGSVFTLGNYNTGGYLPIFDSEGDEIDLLTGVNGVVPFSAEWWKCIAVCIPDFMPPGFPLDESVVNAGGNWGAALFTMTQMETINGVSASASDAINPPAPPDPPATPTPEPPVAIMLLCGIVALGVYSRRYART